MKTYKIIARHDLSVSRYYTREIKAEDEGEAKEKIKNLINRTHIPCDTEEEDGDYGIEIEDIEEVI